MSESSTNINTLSLQQEAMIKALIKTLGVVTSACQKVGIDRSTHYLWMNNNEIYKNSVADIKNIAIDFVESRMFAAIKDGDSSLMKYYLGTQAKERGYVERKEITGKDGEPLETVIKWGDKEIKT